MPPAAIANLAGFLFGAAAALWTAGPPLAGARVETIALEARAIELDGSDAARDRVGALRYLGGLELRARDRRFGGISAILWEDGCARLLAVTDTGAWLILEPEEAGGRLVGLRAAWIAPILGADGRPPANKVEADAEAMARIGDQTFVAFEQDHRLQRYDGISACDPQSLAAPAAAIMRPAAMQGWPANGGAEAVGAVGGSLLILAEDASAGDGLREGLLWNPVAGGGRRLAHRPPRGFAATGTDALPGEATQLLVYRRFTPLEGVSALVGQLAPEGPGTGGEQPLEAEILARLAPPLAVDNMEGIAARREAQRTTIYLASDNNFNRLQRTLLLKFALEPRDAP